MLDPLAKYHHCTSPNWRYGQTPALDMTAAMSLYTSRQNAVLCGPKFVCKAGVFSHTGSPFEYRCAMPAVTLSSPCCNSMLNAAAASIPYAFNAAKYALLQSRAARLILAAAAKSVRPAPSTPPASTPLDVAVNPVLPVAPIGIPLPAAPIVREVIVSVAPSAFAHTPVEPALTKSAKQFAIVVAVSPIRLTCEIVVPPSDTWVVPPKTGEPANVIVPEAYW